MKYIVTHRETLENTFEVEANSAREAINEYHFKVNNGEVDFSDAEICDSEDTVKPDMRASDKWELICFTDNEGHFIPVVLDHINDTKPIVATWCRLLAESHQEIRHMRLRERVKLLMETYSSLVLNHTLNWFITEQGEDIGVVRFLGAISLTVLQ